MHVSDGARITSFKEEIEHDLPHMTEAAKSLPLQEIPVYPKKTVVSHV